MTKPQHGLFLIGVFYHTITRIFYLKLLQKCTKCLLFGFEHGKGTRLSSAQHVTGESVSLPDLSTETSELVLKKSEHTLGNSYNSRHKMFTNFTKCIPDPWRPFDVVLQKQVECKTPGSVASGFSQEKRHWVFCFWKKSSFSSLPSVVLEELKRELLNNVASSEVGSAAWWGRDLAE